MKRISILGSTGSIGTQTLDVVRKTNDFEVIGITTNTSIELVEQQIQEFRPQLVCVMNELKAKELQDKLRAKGDKTEVVTGMDGLVAVATHAECDVVVTAVVGMIGLIPTIEAINAGKDIALANKETLVVAGQLVMNLAKEKGVKILPVDSEHSAIFQCLRAGNHKEIEKLIITASGGPFRTYTKEMLEGVTVKDALNHPNWKMGNKITIDSATLMNKGLEVIEAKHLFDVTVEQIDVVVHKESIVHSMVMFRDGSVIAQLGNPDMRHPIDYALNYPERKENEFIERLNLAKIGTLSFEEPKIDMFPCLRLAISTLKEDGSALSVLNGANEEAVGAFLNEQITFNDIPKIIESALTKYNNIKEPTLEQILEADRWARAYSREQVKNRC